MKGAEGTATYNAVDSGWSGALVGSWTVAWFMKERTPLPDTLAYYLFSGIANFRAFTSGAAGNGLIIGGFGGTDQTLTANIRTPAATRWVHVALVVDATSTTATWYVDGVAQAPTSSAGANVPAGTVTFKVGVHTRLTTGTFWDIDEFRLQNRAASAAEVASWAQTDLAAEGPYGLGCNGRLSAGGGKPTLGNAGYVLNLSGPVSAAFALGIGFDRLSFGGVPLPLNLGLVFPSLQGCNWETSAAVFVNGVLNASGIGLVPLPMPNNPSMVGFVACNQAFLSAGATLATTNPHASAIGN